MKLRCTSSTNGADELMLHCPVCKVEVTRLKEARTTMVEHRLAIRLHFVCERGHDFSHLIYNNEKGTVVTSGL